MVAATICAWAIAAMVCILSVQMVVRYRDGRLVARNVGILALLIGGMAMGM